MIELAYTSLGLFKRPNGEGLDQPMVIAGIQTRQ